MNYTLSMIVFIAGILLLWFYQSGGINKNRIAPAEAKKRLETEKGIIVLDVRTPEEYFEKHIPKSTLIPLNTLAKEAGSKLRDKEATIFVYCRSGNRSRAAVRILLRQGFTNVFNLGGLNRWPYKTVSGKK